MTMDEYKKRVNIIEREYDKELKALSAKYLKLLDDLFIQYKQEEKRNAK